jgi:nicotinate phosphoribosyltransferase
MRDVVALADEAAPPRSEPLLVPVMVGGRPTTTPEGLPVLRERFRHDLARLPAAATALRSPSSSPVHRSTGLDAVTRRVSRELTAGM